VFIPSIVSPPSATLNIPTRTRYSIIMAPSRPWSEIEDVSHRLVIVLVVFEKRERLTRSGDPLQTISRFYSRLSSYLLQ
jgi:hypothetical protein